MTLKYDISNGLFINFCCLIVFYNSVHYIHRDARWRDIMLRIQAKGADDYAARDAQDHKVLRRRPGHN